MTDQTQQQQPAPQSSPGPLGWPSGSDWTGALAAPFGGAVTPWGSAYNLAHFPANPPGQKAP
jgi:hypothetical protein